MTTATIDRCIADKTPMPNPEKRMQIQREADAAANKKGTMCIQLRQGLARQGASYERGDVVDWRADEAKRLISAGYAIPAPKNDKRTAALSPAETR